MNFIQKYNTSKRLNHLLKKIKEDAVWVCSLEQAKSICIFHSFESEELLKEILKSTQSLKNNKKEVVLYCYIPKKHKKMMEFSEKFHFILEKDFDFKGNLPKEKWASFPTQSFDMLIDLDKKKDSRFSLYLSGKINAGFRIGRCENAKEYYNVVLSAAHENYTMKEYFQSIELYTKKMIQE